MKLHKTDLRFKLHKYGFDCYIELNQSDWKNYNRITTYCRNALGNEFYEFAGRVWEKGNWKGHYHHRGRRYSSRRIYFRGEKYHTLLLMALPTDDINTVYL
jgi:hypothetical protein